MALKKQKKKMYLSFLLSKEQFAVPASSVMEVLAPVEITEIPNSHDIIRGVIHFRGQIIPVIETRIIFNLPPNNSSEYVIIIFETTLNNKKVVIGALADSVQEVIPTDDSDILQPPSSGYHFNPQFVTNMLHHNGKYILILNIANVFKMPENLN